LKCRKIYGIFKRKCYFQRTFEDQRVIERKYSILDISDPFQNSFKKSLDWTVISIKDNCLLITIIEKAITRNCSTFLIDYQHSAQIKDAIKKILSFQKT
jgi:hypothetical protein